MKKETYLNKLNELLGLTGKVEEIKVANEAKKGKFVGITEDEIQTFREAQGVIYFLQAPALFQSKVCKHCNHPFLVSRLYVAYCSYTCIRASLKEMGFEWDKGKDIEVDHERMLEYINDKEIYNGQEPLWVRNLSTLEAALQKLIQLNQSASTPKSDQETLTSSVSLEGSLS